jgi:hypothetical protein
MNRSIKTLNIKFFAFLIVACFLIVSCKDKEDPAPTTTPDLTGVFIGGDLNGRATYWKDDVANVIGDETKYSNVWDMFISGPDIYLAGSITDNDANAKSTPAYWKNGQMINLPYNQNRYTYASGIVVLNGDVHVIGSEYDGPGIHIAKYWKNGEEIKLTDGVNWSISNSIQVNGNDVYILGIDGNASKYWKNGTATILDLDGAPRAMAISGNDIYFAGTNGTSAVYWKNGVVTKLAESTRTTSVTSIFVSGTDVYVTGIESSADFRSATAKYWKNGLRINLNDESKAVHTNDIAVLGNDVYVVGAVRRPNNTSYTPRYWKNGEAHDLAISSTPNAFANCIVIKN